MNDRILTADAAAWGRPLAGLVAALEAGKVLYFPNLRFALSPDEQGSLRPDVRDGHSRNISLRHDGVPAGAALEGDDRARLAAMMERFRTLACALVDAFPSRPNRGERILRVFTNLNPHGEPRVWRVGEAFEDIARRFVPRAKPYVAWQAKALRALRVTKSLRTEYDHLMLQLHDGMKADGDYQRDCPQVTMPFPPGSTWVCFSDQTAHAVMSGQFMMEQNLHLAAERQVDPQASPLAILERQLGRRLT